MLNLRRSNQINRSFSSVTPFSTEQSHFSSVIFAASQHRKSYQCFALLVLSLLLLFLPLVSSLPSQNARSSLAMHTTSSQAFHFHSAALNSNAAAPVGLTPQDLWRLYHLPGLSGGTGQLIAEVIDGDIPTLEADLKVYNQRFGLPACSIANGCLLKQYQDGKRIAPGNDPSEGILDVEIMHAMAPQARILLYIMHTDNASIARGPREIINTPGLKAINMSYGFDGNGLQYEHLYADNPNQVALFAASGDDGHGVLAPPSIYPEVIAVGGTTVNGTIEKGWSGSGGGLAHLYPEPAYQKTYGIPHANNQRGNPDVAAIAGTDTAIYATGQWFAEYGTSVSAPIWTGIAALVDRPITNDLLYQLASSQPAAFNDITAGGNGTCGFICTAHPGYDYVTGLGTPKDFVALVNALPY